MKKAIKKSVAQAKPAKQVTRVGNADKTKTVTAAKRTRTPQADAPAALFDRVASILDAARGSIVRAVNHRMVLAYWLIGREIVVELQGGADRAEYGKRLLADLSKRLTQKYGDGFSVSSVKDFRLFYSVFVERDQAIGHTASGQLRNTTLSAEMQKSHTLCGESGDYPSPGAAHTDFADTPAFHPNLSWSHYRALMRVEKPDARGFYESECVAAVWSVRELERQIHSFYFERLLVSKDRKGMLQAERKAGERPDPIEILKSSSVLEFLGLPDSPRLHESELEQAIMDNLQTFLLELGRGFSFVARQKRLAFESDEFYVDLVFYNYLIKCFVLIDLKIGKLTHQDVGQMDSYVRLYEDLHKVPGDNPTIGLILCSEKNETIARYSVLKESRQLFASKYRLYLPTEEELAIELRREIRVIEEGKAG